MDMSTYADASRVEPAALEAATVRASSPSVMNGAVVRVPPQPRGADEAIASVPFDDAAAAAPVAPDPAAAADLVVVASETCAGRNGARSAAAFHLHVCCIHHAGDSPCDSVAAAMLCSDVKCDELSTIGRRQQGDVHERRAVLPSADAHRWLARVRHAPKVLA